MVKNIIFDGDFIDFLFFLIFECLKKYIVI